MQNGSWQQASQDDFKTQQPQTHSGVCFSPRAAAAVQAWQVGFEECQMLKAQKKIKKESKKRKTICIQGSQLHELGIGRGLMSLPGPQAAPGSAGGVPQPPLTPAASPAFLCVSQIKAAIELEAFPMQINRAEFAQRQGEEWDSRNSPIKTISTTPHRHEGRICSLVPSPSLCSPWLLFCLRNCAWFVFLFWLELWFADNLHFFFALLPYF